MIILISGLPTSGKTNLAKLLEKELNSFKFIDPNNYLLNPDFVDWDAMRLKLLQASIDKENIILVANNLKIKPDLSIYLKYNLPIELKKHVIRSLGNYRTIEQVENIISLHKCKKTDVTIDLYDSKFFRRSADEIFAELTSTTFFLLRDCIKRPK